MHTNRRFKVPRLVGVVLTVQTLSFAAINAGAAVSSDTIKETVVMPEKAKPVPAETVETEKFYVVQHGDFLGAIAKAHATTIQQLLTLNKLENADKIYAGMKLALPGDTAPLKAVPKKTDHVTITIPKGFSLWKISKAYNVSVKSILRANRKLKNPDDIKAGQSLIIPGVNKVVELVPPPPCYNPAVEFYRVRTDETQMIHLTFCNGRVNPAAVEQLSNLSYQARLKKAPFPLHPRLAKMLQKVANKFEGKRIEIISGQRVGTRQKKEAYHGKGQAIDFRVQGVSNRKLVNYIKTFKNAGVGYYPNSVFVHMDTRDRNAFWIDYSAPGEKAIYAKRNLSARELKAIRDKRKNISLEKDAVSTEKVKENNKKESPVNVEGSEASAIVAALESASVEEAEKSMTAGQDIAKPVVEPATNIPANHDTPLVPAKSDGKKDGADVSIVATLAQSNA